jgi:serine protease inhibitor
MKTIFLLASLLFFFLFCNSCIDNPVSALEEEPLKLSAEEKFLLQKNSQFSFNIFNQINQQSLNSNTFISPLSIFLALGMTYNGAANATKDSLASVLGIENLSDDEFNETSRSLINALLRSDPKLIMKIANSIWIREGFLVEIEFINVNQQYFNASVRNLNFSDGNAAQIINQWVSSNTNGYIDKIIEFVPSHVVMYLINAVYFEGKWKYSFDKDKTYNGIFYLPDGSNKMCKMMKQLSAFKVSEGNNFVAVDLPYGNSSFSMTIILPHENTDINTVINSFDYTSWNDLMNNFSEREIVFSMPKFRFSYEVADMKTALENLGMGICFDPYNADFTRINSLGGLFINEVKHKAFIDVDEEGTKAAAVTSVGIGRVSTPPAVVLNRPFLFFIRESVSNSLLFMGKIVNPVFE